MSLNLTAKSNRTQMNRIHQSMTGRVLNAEEQTRSDERKDEAARIKRRRSAAFAALAIRDVVITQRGVRGVITFKIPKTMAILVRTRFGEAPYAPETLIKLQFQKP